MARSWNAALIAIVDEMLAAGEPHASIAERCRVDFGMSAKMVRRYVDRVHEQWLADAVGSTDDERRSRAAACYLSLYREARAKGHTRIAGEMIEKWCRLFGIGTTSQVAVGIFDDRGVVTSAAAIEARIAELRRQLGDGGGGN